MAKKQITTSISINAPVEKVWDIFTDFSSYETWNPFIKSIKGNIKPGNTIHVNLDGMKMKPKVLVFEKNQEFRWKGKLFFRGLFDGEHLFRLEKTDDGKTIFYHEEYFNGILVPLFSKMLDNKIKPSFIEMNEKLKELAEASD